MIFPITSLQQRDLYPESIERFFAKVQARDSYSMHKYVSRLRPALKAKGTNP